VDWVDPYIGARIQHPVADRWTLVGYGDIGGFGVGSDFAWQAIAGVNYDFSKSVSGKLGYRYLAVDYDKDGFLYEMDSYGAYLGVGFRF
jgi:opacity protein-like surface antigen